VIQDAFLARFMRTLPDDLTKIPYRGDCKGDKPSRFVPFARHEIAQFRTDPVTFTTIGRVVLSMACQYFSRLVMV